MIAKWMDWLSVFLSVCLWWVVTHWHTWCDGWWHARCQVSQLAQQFIIPWSIYVFFLLSVRCKQSCWYHLNPDLSAPAGSAVVVTGGATLFSCSLQVTQFAQHALFPDGLPAKHNISLSVSFTQVHSLFTLCNLSNHPHTLMHTHLLANTHKYMRGHERDWS